MPKRTHRYGDQYETERNDDPTEHVIGEQGNPVGHGADHLALMCRSGARGSGISDTQAELDVDLPGGRGVARTAAVTRVDHVAGSGHSCRSGTVPYVASTCGWTARR